MINILKRAFYAVVLSTLFLGITPYLYFYFNNSSDNRPNTQQNNFKPKDTNETSSRSSLNSKLTANVVISPQLWTNTFSIDKGNEDDVEFGNIVTDSNGKVIGVVDVVLGQSSTVKTITNPDTKIAVWVGKPSNKGLLSGVYGYSSQVDWIQDSSDIIDQPVYTSGFSKNTKEGLFIGNVQDVKLGKSGSFYLAHLKNLTNIWQTDGTVLVW